MCWGNLVWTMVRELDIALVDAVLTSGSLQP